MYFHSTSFLLILIIAFIGFSGKIQAQETFAPIGATWTYKVESAFSGPLGYQRIVSEKDTTLFGKAVRKLRYLIMSSNHNGFPEPFYIYQNKDSVFQIYPEDGALQLLFRNDMEVGDTLTLPLYFPYNLEYRSLIVDSVKMVEYQLNTLKEMYLSVIGDCFGNFGVVINSRFGPFAGFYFVGSLCNETVSSFLICYEDPDFQQIQFYSFFSCDIETSVEEIGTETSTISLYPNPSTAQITLTLPPGASLGNSILKIVSLSGQVLRQEQVDLSFYTTLDISDLPAGVYFLQIKDEDGVSIIKKVVKQ